MAPYSRPFGAEPFGGSRSSNITDLILRRGDIAAQRALDSGAMWGGAIANIGQAVGGMLAKREEQKQLKKQEQALFALFQREDASPEDYMAVLGPERGVKVWTGLQAAMETRNKAGREAKEEAFKRVPLMADAFLNTPAGLREQGWQFLRETVIASGLDNGQGLPEQYDPEVVDPLVRRFAPKKQRRVENVKGQLVEVPEEGPAVPIFGEPEAPKPDSRSLDARYADAVASGDVQMAQTLLNAKRQLEAAGRAPTGAPEGPKVGSLEAFLVNKYGPNPTAEQQIEGLAAYEAAKTGGGKEAGEELKPLSGEAAMRLAYSNTALKLAPDLKASLKGAKGRARYIGAYWGVDTELKRKIEDFIDTSVRARSGATTNVAELAERRGQIYSAIDAMLKGGDTTGALAAIDRIEQEMGDLQQGLDPSGAHRKGLSKGPSPYLSTDENEGEPVR